MENKYWIVVDVGCMECGEETYIEGVYLTEEEAKSKEKDYFTDGQRGTKAFEISIPQKT